MGRLGSRVPALGIRTLSDLQIDVDKDWRAHGIYNLGDLTPKVDGAYNIGSSAAEFDTVYAKAGPPPGADSIGREELKEPAVDTAYLYDNAATSAKVGPSVDLEFVRSNDNVVAGGITPKVDGAYNLGDPTAQFNNAYASNVPPLVTEPVSNAAGDLDSVRDVSSGALALENLLASPDAANVVDNTNLGVPKAADIIYQSELTASKGASIFDNTNLGVARAADITYQTELQPVKAASIFDNANLTVSRAADIAYQSELMPVKFADIFDHSNLGSAKAKDIVYHGNFNLPSAEARDKVAKSTYGVAKDVTGVKGFVYQLHEKRDFAFRTETPNHAYWHRMYNTPATFETVYQDYTTSMQKKGTTPSKSAPGTADPNPQPGACWSVSMLPDGTQVGGFVSPDSVSRSTAWDGTYLWVIGANSNYVYQLKTDGTQVGGFPAPTTDNQGLTWDGAYVWYTDYTARYVYQLKTDGTKVSGFASPGNARGISWDGTYLWHNIDSANMYKLKPDGTQVTSFPVPSTRPRGVGWDGTYLWSSRPPAPYIYQLKTDGTQVGGFTPPAEVYSGAWDGAYFWGATNGYIYLIGNAGNFDVNYRIFAK